MSEDINIRLNTTQLDQDIAEVDKKLVQVSQRVTNVARKGFNTIVILGQITGKAVDQSYQLMAQAAFVAAETVMQIAAAESVTVVGLINAGLGLTAAAAIFHQALKLKLEGGKASVEIQGIISLANEWRF